MKNPASSTENSNPGFAKSTQGLCVRASGRQFLSVSRAFSLPRYPLRSMSRFTLPQGHKMTLAVTRRPILSTAAVILPTRRANLWPSDAILPTGRVILRTVGAILCTVGAILRGFCDILPTIAAFSPSRGALWTAWTSWTRWTAWTSPTVGAASATSIASMRSIASSSSMLPLLPDAPTPLSLNH